MNQRQAQKILKYREKLNYTEEQIRTAEQTVEAYAKKNAKSSGTPSAKEAEKSE